ncbi:sulfatase-like hydrolase/transferase [Aquimonas voraii]|uniref:Phosphoethanolamine transferase for glucans (OPG), alkaline phosphatase superfamily n=1 Tax=Aquimonas voraii TaxID=265719 RepID=A0A1G6S1X3_9GAMM|nr:sulfatase-like hydrolase/transferase [Aquimonas voraii]SDD10691.1 Phosphoethanolamine transferase for glucans (OPG), alkaline phosphatase superfamily [Aquimonas voraii]
MTPPEARSQETRAAALRGAVLELCLLLLPALLFLAAYLGAFHAPWAAAPRHLAIILPAIASLMLLRPVAMACLPRRFARPLIATVYGAWFLGWGLYYGTVVMGLQSWGRVATWPLIEVYLLQWRDLLAVLGVPVGLALLAGACVFAATLAIGWMLARREAWALAFRSAVRPGLALCLLALAVAISAYRAFEVRDALHVGSHEPLLLTFHPWAGSPSTQTNRTQGARVIDEREAAAAAAYVPGQRTHTRHVILIVGDALRADRMHLFGNLRNTTPWLSALQAEGRLQLAARAHAMCAESFCGLMALARSKYLHEFSAHNLSLGHVLRRHGYAVYLILGGDHTNFYGLAEALGPADLYWDGLQSSEYMNDDRAVLARARELPPAGDTPVFMQFHLMSSHGLGKRHEEFQQFSPIVNYYVRNRLAGTAQERQAWARNFYDNGLLQFDHTVAELLGVLEERGYLQDAVVVVTGDHGELLGERGRYSHADTVLQGVLDVPILLMRRGYAGEPIAEPRLAAQIDIAPTVLAELGFPVPESWSGSALQDGVNRDFSYFQQGPDVGLFDLRDPLALWKYWRNVRDGKEEAYRIDLDPGEQNNLIDSVPAEHRRVWLREILRATTAVSGLPSSDMPEESNK